jgi:hypothetical protein
MYRKKKIKSKEKTNLDPISQEWLDSIPTRTEKNRYRYHFLRLKKSIMCNLGENAFGDLRF